MSSGSTPPMSTIPAPQQTSVQIDKEQQERIAAYLSTRRRFASFWNSVLVLFFFFVIIPWAYSVIAAIFGNPEIAIQPLANWYPLRMTVIYFYAVGVLCAILFPSAFIRGFLLPNMYKIRPSKFPIWLIGWAAKVFILTSRWLAFFELGYLLIVVQPNSWWIWMALILSFIGLGKSHILPTFFFARFYKCTEITDKQLTSMVSELIYRSSRKTGIKRFFKIQDKTKKEANRKELPPNGYLAGWGETRSIILTDGLLRNFAFAEIKMVLAHELGHHAHHDLSKRQVLAVFLLAGELFVWNLMYHWCLSFPNMQDIRLLQQGYYWLLFLLGIRLGVYLLTRKYSRHNEWQADEFALQLTGDYVAFKSMIVRLMNMNHNPYTLSPATEIEQSHPSARRRLQHADEFEVRLARAREETNRT